VIFSKSGLGLKSGSTFGIYTVRRNEILGVFNKYYRREVFTMFNCIKNKTNMKNKWIALLAFGLLFSVGCVKETVYLAAPLITDADVYYEFIADNIGTEVSGEIYNDGETYINAVQLEIRLYDRRGIIIEYDYLWVDTYFDPGQSVRFYVDLPHRGVWDVDVVINRYD